ncbi:MAG: tetratricopeptide repeat protein, partial [Asticcacaulis sp.]
MSPTPDSRLPGADDTNAVTRARRLLAPAKKAKPLSLNAALRTTAMIAVAASFGLTGFAIGGPADVGQVAPRSDIDIRVGRNDHSGRIEIYGAIGSRASVRRDGDQVVVRLPGNRQPDLGDIRANPPIGIAGVEVKSDARATELWLKVASGYDTHFGRADGGVFIQVDPEALARTPTSEGKPGGAPTVNLQNTPADSQPKAAASTVPSVDVAVADAGGGRELTFAFAGPAATAVFRRGDAVWIVFDTEVALHIPPQLKDGAVINDVQWTHNDGFTAMRLAAPSTGSLSVQNDGLLWRVRLGGHPLDSKPSQVAIIRDDSSGVPGLNVNLAGASKVAWIRDPAVGDRMAIVPARGPVKNLSSARTTLEATLGSTAQGVVIEHMTPDVKVALDGDLIEVTRPGGLTLSARDANTRPDDSRLEYKAALYPALMNPDWSNPPAEGFLARYNDLQAAAADEAQGGAGAPTKSRLALARFLVGQGLSFEAQGALDLMTRQSPHALDDPQVRGLRVVARMLSRRYADAAADLSSPQLATDPASRLWAGYAEVKAGHYADAVKDLQAGMKALGQFPVEWRTRIAAAHAYAALQLNDMKTAQVMIGFATTQPAQPLDRLGAYLIDAQIIEATGDKQRALGVYSAVARASDERLAAPAAMHVAMLSYQLRRATADQTLAQLDALRFRWRGDDTELQLVANMGQIYLSEGRYRDALQVLKTGNQQFSDQPQAVKIQTSLNQAFRNLFLGGMADGLQPIEALGLFNDFKDLTPIGADGDEMVRRIVRRLVDV